MPHMISIEANPDFAPKTPAEKEALAAAKKAGPVSCDTGTALENIRLSNGLYRLVPAAADVDTIKPRTLAEYSNEELKLLFLSLGFKTEKQMRRDDMIKSIQTRLDAVEVISDEGQS